MSVMCHVYSEMWQVNEDIVCGCLGCPVSRAQDKAMCCHIYRCLSYKSTRIYAQWCQH